MRGERRAGRGGREGGAAAAQAAAKGAQQPGAGGGLRGRALPVQRGQPHGRQDTDRHVLRSPLHRTAHSHPPTLREHYLPQVRKQTRIRIRIPRYFSKTPNRIRCRIRYRPSYVPPIDRCYINGNVHTEPNLSI